MPTLSTIVDGVINLNLLLVAAFVLWMLARGMLQLAGHQRAFVLQLSLLNWLFGAVLIGPVLVGLYEIGVSQGLIARNAAPNLSDFFVAQYLVGRIDMRPADFEWVLSQRDTMLRALLLPTSSVAYGVLGLLGLGHLLLVGRFALNAWRLRQVLRSSYAWRRFGRLHLCLTDVTHVPFSTRGLRRHYIIIPTGLLADKVGLKMAIAHEIQHMRQGDIGWEIGLETLRLMFFWNPVFHVWKRAVDRIRELACDQQLLARGRFDPVAYSDCLLRICRNGLRQGVTLRHSTVSMVETSPSMLGADRVAFLRYRIAALLATPPPAPGRLMELILLVPLVAVLALGALSMQQRGDWSHDRLMLSTIVNLERLRANPGQ